MRVFVTLSSCLVLLCAALSHARADDGATPTGPTGEDSKVNNTTTRSNTQHNIDAHVNNTTTRSNTQHNIDAHVNNTTTRSNTQHNVTLEDKPQGSQGIGLGAMTGNATDGTNGAVPQTLQFEYFNVGRNPSQGGRGYGLMIDKLEFSGVSDGTPQMAIETRGMSGWQLIGASNDRPVMFHLGVEPLNFEGQVTSNLPSDIQNTIARAAQSKTDGATGTSSPVGGNPNAPVLRQQYLYYVPAVSAGIEVRKAGCRFLALVRGGAAGGAMLRTDNGYSYGVDPAYGAGIYVNCPQFDVDGEWTRIQQSDAPMDLLNADIMYKPLRNIPLAVGLELGSTVTNSQDPKDVPLEVPGYGVKGAEVETHASGMVRLTF